MRYKLLRHTFHIKWYQIDKYIKLIHNYGFEFEKIFIFYFRLRARLFGGWNHETINNFSYPKSFKDCMRKNYLCP